MHNNLKKFTDAVMQNNDITALDTLLTMSTREFMPEHEELYFLDVIPVGNRLHMFEDIRMMLSYLLEYSCKYKCITHILALDTDFDSKLFDESGFIDLKDKFRHISEELLLKMSPEAKYLNELYYITKGMLDRLNALPCVDAIGSLVMTMYLTPPFTLDIFLKDMIDVSVNILGALTLTKEQVLELSFGESTIGIEHLQAVNDFIATLDKIYEKKYTE